MAEWFTLSGWGQPPDALRVIASPEDDVMHLDYRTVSHIERFMDKVGRLTIAPDVVVGWSLGGLLATQLIEARILKPELLVLLGTPFQFVADRHFPGGLPEEKFEEIRSGYIKDPKAVLEGLKAGCASGDSKEQEILSTLRSQPIEPQGWLYWLEELGHFTCGEVNFEHFPPTLIIHGNNDAIVHAHQAISLRSSIPGSECIIIENCGHCPHLHDPERINTLISNAL